MSDIIPLRETERIFTGDGLGTRRLNEYLRELTTTVNTNDASSEDIAEVQGGLNSVLSQLINVKKSISDIESQTLIMDLSPLESRITDIENNINQIIDLSIINSRLDAIESQI